MENNFFKKSWIQTLISSLLCIILGLVLGLVVLLIINPSGAFDAIKSVIGNFLTWKRGSYKLYYLADTLVRMVPLLMCSLAVLFSYKVGLFNIGTSGQYCAGICACLFGAIFLHLPWYLCLLLAIIAGALVAAIVGVLKAYLNVNEVISGIMLNWIMLYLTNLVLDQPDVIKNTRTLETFDLSEKAPQALLPKLNLFGNNFTSIAIPLSIILAVLILVILNYTKFGYELKATGYNKNAAKYCGMMENTNIILSLVISGALAGVGAAFYYLSGIENWNCSTATVPAMGFNGIAATFLGGLHPIGTIFSSFFIEQITLGGSYVNMRMYSSQISDLISSLIIYLCGFVMFIKITINSIISKVTSNRENKNIKIEGDKK